VSGIDPFGLMQMDVDPSVGARIASFFEGIFDAIMTSAMGSPSSLLTQQITGVSPLIGQNVDSSGAPLVAAPGAYTAGSLLTGTLMGVGTGVAAEPTAGGIGPVLQGQQGVATAIAQFEAQGAQVLGTEITMDAGGVRARPDLLIQNADGSQQFVEVKTGGGELTPNQKIVYPLIEQGGAVPAGANAANAGLTPGVPLPPTPVRVIYISPLGR
jgi:hypothetical protein